MRETTQGSLYWLAPTSPPHTLTARAHRWLQIS
eukprot:COSAG02_NODE_26405_length_634_cov_0.450467_1_plen_32_part_01